MLRSQIFERRRNLQTPSLEAGANTVRLQWSTQSNANGSGALTESGYDQILLRTTQSNGEVEREPQVSTRGFFRQFPAVVVVDSPLELRFD